MYLFQPTSTLAVYMLFLLVRIKALPQSSSLAQRAPTDLRNNRTIELDDIRDILVDSERSPPTGKVTLNKADKKWNTDKEWLVYDVEGLVDGDGKPMTATATTRVDGNDIDREYIDKDVLLGYGHDSSSNQRWWMLESKIPNDIRRVKKLDIQLNYISMGSQPVSIRNVTAINISEADDISEGFLYFTIRKWVDDTEVYAFTRVNGGRIDPAAVKRYKEDDVLILYGYEQMEEPYRRRWWLVYKKEELEYLD